MLVSDDDQAKAAYARQIDAARFGDVLPQIGCLASDRQNVADRADQV
jgi:hypothetical protein